MTVTTHAALSLDDGKVRMAVGTPGGSTIFGSVFLTSSTTDSPAGPTSPR